jgi:hypothetical protein
VKFIKDLFKRYASKQNKQLKASQKGMLDKMEVEAVENRLKTASSLIEFLKKGVERLFCMFCITGRYNLEFIKKPSYLIEKEVRYTK